MVVGKCRTNTANTTTNTETMPQSMGHGDALAIQTFFNLALMNNLPVRLQGKCGETSGGAQSSISKIENSP